MVVADRFHCICHVSGVLCFSSNIPGFRLPNSPHWLLSSLRLVVVRLPVGYEIWPLIGWHQLLWLVGSPFFINHWQSLHTALTGDKNLLWIVLIVPVPSIYVSEGDMYIFINTQISMSMHRTAHSTVACINIQELRDLSCRVYELIIQIL